MGYEGEQRHRKVNKKTKQNPVDDIKNNKIEICNNNKESSEHRPPIQDPVKEQNGQGDGLNTEQGIKKKNSGNPGGENSDKFKSWENPIRINIEIDIISLSLFFVALSLRLYRLEEPKNIV